MSAIRALKHQIGTNPDNQYLNLVLQTDNSGNLVLSKGNWDTVPPVDLLLVYNDHKGIALNQSPTTQASSLSFINRNGVTQGSFGYDHDNQLAFIGSGSTAASPRLYIGSDTIRPAADNSINFGSANFKWNAIFARTSVINTSDQNQKCDVSPIDEKILKAWAKVNFVQYRFISSVDEKGDSARVHFGMIAQKVKEAFESEGVDPFKYGLLCKDTWEEIEYQPVLDADGNDTGEVNTIQIVHEQYGIRYDEALVLECAYLRSKLESK